MGDSHYKIASKGGTWETPCIYLFSFMLKEKVLVSSSMVTLSNVWILLISPFFLDDVVQSLLFYSPCFLLTPPNRQLDLN